MKLGLIKFEFYLNQLEELFKKAKSETDAGLYLYEHDARTTCFMLEGLSKLYEGIHNPNKFDNLRKLFKALEDSLGAVDYYDGLLKEFSSNTAVPITITAYFKSRKGDALQEFNNLLDKKNWLDKKNNRFDKIREKLANADWLKQQKEQQKIVAFYQDAILEFDTLAIESMKGFTELEDEVHELRRRLRWLSIYPRALQGTIQLSDDTEDIDPEILNYCTTAIINSPFNKMPDVGNNEAIVWIRKNYFYALSWMIAELGKIKDKGLSFEALVDAFEVTENLEHEQALKISGGIIGLGADTLEKTLASATEICKPYFEKGYIHQLLDLPKMKLTD